MQNYDFNYTLTKSSAKKNPERINYADVGYCRLDVVTGLLEVTPRRVRGSERRDCQ